MERDLKQLTFIALAQTLFDNELKGIVKDNCIEFYHYLLDGLEKKREALLAADDENFLVYDTVIGILEDFPKMDEQELSDIMKYRNYAIEYIMERTLMSNSEVTSAMHKLKADVLIRMSLFLDTP
jgi:hypothetical protein